MTTSPSDTRGTVGSPPRRSSRGLVRSLFVALGEALSRRLGTVRTLAAAVAAWTAAGTAGALAWLVACAVLCACGGFVLLRGRVRGGYRRHRSPERAGVPGAGSELGSVVAGIALWAGTAGLLAGAHAHHQAQTPQPETAAVVMVGESHETASGRYRAFATGETGRVQLIAPDPLPPAGTRVRVRLDWWGTGFAGASEVHRLAPPGPVWEARAHLRASLARASAGEHAGADLLPGLVIGDTAALSDQLQEDMRTVSLTHVTAVSGANIIIVAGVVLVASSYVWRRWWLRLLPAVCVTAGYVFVVGPEPSVTRAAAMAALTAIGLLRPVGTPTVAVLASAVTVLLIGQPQLAREIGFALSAAATAGLVLLSPRLTRLLTDRGVTFLLAAAVAVPAAAQLAVTPLLIVLAPQLSPWSVPANLVAGPAVAPATVLGLAAMVCEALGLTRAGLLAGGLGALGAWWITAVAQVAARLPGAALRWPEAPGGVALAVVLVALTAGALLTRGTPRLTAAALACGLAVGGISVPQALAPGRGPWTVLVCDVGQGSAALIRSAAEHSHALLVDTGDDPEALARCFERTGITRLTLVLSHFDRDHVGALPEAAGAAQVQGLVYPAALAHTPEAAEARTVVRGSQDELPVLVHAAAGVPLPESVLPAGVSAHVLWPVPGSGSSGDGNASSLVLAARADGISVLLPGDIGRSQSLALAPAVADGPAFDIMLAPHHGSADMSALLHRAARPRMGAVSVGADNSYGHPTPAAVEAFGPAPVLRTDECGTLIFTADGGVRAEEAECMAEIRS